MLTIPGLIVNINWGAPIRPLNEHKDLHFDSQKDIHRSSEHIWGKWLWARFGIGNHLALIVCFLSSAKWVQRKKYLNNMCLPEISSKKAYRWWRQRRCVAKIFNENSPFLVFDSKILDAERTLSPSRIIWLQKITARSQRNMPLGCDLDFVIDRELTAALCVVPPQAFLPHKRSVHRGLHLVEPKVFGCRPNLAPKLNLGVSHHAFDEDRVLPDLITRQSTSRPGRSWGEFQGCPGDSGGAISGQHGHQIHVQL